MTSAIHQKQSHYVNELVLNRIINIKNDTLDLSFCNLMSLLDIISLIKIIRPKFTILNVSNNQLYNAGGLDIILLLNPFITKIDMSNNNIREFANKYLIKAIFNKPNYLQELNLSNNKIDTIYAFKYIKKCYINTLDLSGNRIVNFNNLIYLKSLSYVNIQNQKKPYSYKI